jgi:hypothetical protein
MLIYLIAAIIHFASHYINQYGNTDYPNNIAVSTEMFFHTGLFVLFKYCKTGEVPWTTYKRVEKALVSVGFLAWLDGLLLLFSYSVEHRYFHLALGTIGTYGLWYLFMINIAVLRKHALTISGSCTVLIYAAVALTSLLDRPNIISMFHHIDAVSYLLFYVVDSLSQVQTIRESMLTPTQS